MILELIGPAIVVAVLQVFNPHAVDPESMGLPAEAKTVDVELSEVVDILSEYSIVHDNSGLLRFMQYYGLTDPHAKVIYINDLVDQSYRRDTVIHEIYHVIYHRRGYESAGPAWETLIGFKSHETYLKLYSAPAPAHKVR